MTTVKQTYTKTHKTIQCNHNKTQNNWEKMENYHKANTKKIMTYKGLQRGATTKKRKELNDKE